MIVGCRPCKIAARSILIGLSGTKWAAFTGSPVKVVRLLICMSHVKDIYVNKCYFSMCLKVIFGYFIDANCFDIASTGKNKLLRKPKFPPLLITKLRLRILLLILHNLKTRAVRFFKVGI